MLQKKLKIDQVSTTLEPMRELAMQHTTSQQRTRLTSVLQKDNKQ